MSDLVRGKREKQFKVPGTLLFVGDKKVEKINIHLFEYGENDYSEKEIINLDDLSFLTNNEKVYWLNIDGVHNPTIIEKVGKIYNLHQLTLEDILNTNHRPKAEEHDEYIHVVMKMPYMYEDNIAVEQVSFILGKNYVITFQEGMEDVFNPVREIIRRNKGKLRKKKADYLLYALMDSVVDGYLTVLENMSEIIENVEDRLIKHKPGYYLRDIYSLKKLIMFLRKSIFPVKDIISILGKTESDLICENTQLYLRDTADHIVHSVELIDIFREMLAEMFNIYVSQINSKTNEIMKWLTILSSIFIPITFVVGIYGMNFEHMPEIKWIYGYPFVMAINVLIILFMVLYFKRKKWI